MGAIVAVLVMVTVELVLGWDSLVTALHQLRRPHLGWLFLAVAAEIVSMNAYARMQRRLLQSAGVKTPFMENVHLAYAAHSLNETLPGGPAFSTRLNFQQMRRFGATPAVASWVIALSGILSACALAVITVGSALAAGGNADWRHLIGLLTATILLILGARRIARRPELFHVPLAAFNRMRRRPAAHGRDRIQDFLDQLRAARLRPSLGLSAAFLALLNWLLDAAGLWLCFRAIGEPAPGITATLLAFCAAMAAGTVTIVPGGLGIIDSALILGLITGGVTAPVAVAAAVLYRVISFGFIIGLGWLSWLRLHHQDQRSAAAAARHRPGRPAGRTPRTFRRGHPGTSRPASRHTIHR